MTESPQTPPSHSPARALVSPVRVLREERAWTPELLAKEAGIQVSCGAGDEGDPRAPLPSATLPARWLGLELKRLRKAAGLTGAQVVASRAISAQAVLSRCETGNDAAKLAQQTVRALAELHRVGDSPEMQALMRRTRRTPAHAPAAPSGTASTKRPCLTGASTTSSASCSRIRPTPTAPPTSGTWSHSKAFTATGSPPAPTTRAPRTTGRALVTVIVLTNCPVGVRDFLARWLLEISAGVFVGTPPPASATHSGKKCSSPRRLPPPAAGRRA
ncbi:hypothetical protein BZZ08_00576 [Streptomyces sp. MH60]|nr:hypothetical protein BZZ08_00576 [Streptomyces sp. MH60]